MGFIGAVSAIGLAVAQAHLLDAFGVGAAEVNVVVEVSRASELLAHVCRHEEVVGVATFLV